MTKLLQRYLLNDPHAPMVTVSLEEPALAPARTLVRVPYLEHLLTLVQRGCAPADLPTAIAPALAQAHADLATYLATVLAGLFDPARLELLPEALADYRSLGDPNVVTRALLAQINYIGDVAANMPANTHHGQWGLPPSLARATEIHHDCAPLAHSEYVPPSASGVVLA